MDARTVETLAKAAKAIVMLASCVGIELDPDHVETILKTAFSISSCVYIVEAFLKKRREKVSNNGDQH